MTSTYADITDALVGDQFTEDILNQLIDNEDFLRHPPRATYSPSLAASTITTASATFVDLTGFSVAITTQGEPIEIEFDARVNTTNARFDFVVDGVSITGDNDGLGAASPVSTFCAVSIKRRVAVLAGAHTVKVQWRSTSGTITLYPAGLAQLSVHEEG